MIKILLNKQEYEFKDKITVKEIIGERSVGNVAMIWVNGKQLPIENYATYEVQNGDEIKVQRFMAGG